MNNEHPAYTPLFGTALYILPFKETRKPWLPPRRKSFLCINKPSYGCSVEMRVPAVVSEIQ